MTRRSLAGIAAALLLLVAAPAVGKAALTQGQISSILDVLAAFEVDAPIIEQVSGILSGSPLAPSPVAPAIVLTRSLFVGLKGPDVAALQQFLKNTGHYAYPDITGYFGAVTKAAVIAFQRAHGISPIGIVGPATRAQIHALAGPAGMPGSTPAPARITYLRDSSSGGGDTPADTTAPTVSLTAPADSDSVSGLAVAVSANASDDTGVSGVTFKVDGETIEEDTTSPYSISWDSADVSDGSHELVAVARDAAGNVASSTAVTVTVSNSAGSVDLYWVGGTGDWSDPHHWAITSGGTGQYSPPTTANEAHFDSASSDGSYTVTIDAAAATATTTIENPASGAPTFAGSAAWTNAGGLTLVSGMGWTYTGAMTFTSTAGGKEITTAGVTLDNDITFNGTGGGWTLQDNLANSDDSTITLTAGTLNTNAKTVSAGSFVLTGTTARTLTATNSTFNLAGDATAWNATTITNLTRTLTGSTINLTGDGPTFAGGSITTYGTTTITGGGAAIISGTNTHVNLTVTGAANVDDSLQINNNQTVSGTLTLEGNSQSNRLFVKVNGNSTGRTLTAATVDMSNVDFYLITGAGAGTWSGTSIGDAQRNTGITFTASTTRYWVGNGGNWSDQSHWSTSSGGSGGASMPLPQDFAIFDANSITSAGQTITFDGLRYASTTFETVANSPTVSIPQSVDIYGSLTLAENMTVEMGNIENQGIRWMHTSGTAILTTNGNQTLANLDMGVSTTRTNDGVLQLGDDLYLTRQLTHSGGTFDANDFDIYTDQFRSNTVSPRSVLMGSGTWHMSDANGSIWTVTATNMTLDAETSTILYGSINNHTTPSQTRRFNGGGFDYHNFTWNEPDSLFDLEMEDANTFNDFTVVNGANARALTFAAGTTNTVASFTTSGVGQLTISSDTAGSTATLSDDAGTNTVTNALVKDMVATGGATWDATASTNGGNTSGWSF